MINKKQQFLPAGFLLAVVFVLVLLRPVADWFADFNADTLLKLHDREASDKVFFVYIDSQDVDELGGWPITRDYYGYLVHVLKQAGARLIAIDVLFSTPDKRYPEYDRDFGHFVRTAGNVILPFAFSHLTDRISKNGVSYALGDSPRLPFQPLPKVVRGMGFGNLAEETVARQGLLAAWGDSIAPSLGLECARQFLLGEAGIQVNADDIVMSTDSTAIVIPTDARHRIRLNHFRLDKLASMSLVDLFQTFQQAPESLHVKDKLVFVGVAAPGVAPMKVTPLHAAFPASLIHLTAAENIIERNFIRTPGALATALILLAVIALAFFLTPFTRRRAAIFIGILVLYVVAVAVIFKTSAVALPLLQTAMTAALSVAAFSALVHYQRSRSQTELQEQYAREIAVREQKLSEAESGLRQLQARLADEKTRSDENRRALDAKEQEILQLQKELRDLSVTAEPPTSATSSFSHIIHAPDSPMSAILELVHKVASDDIPVLISGETGTGKEIIARAIHDAGSRAGKAFIAVNCGALPETLLESELFGHERGAFTGAAARRKGRFELAHGGTLFLDEITETSANFQAKLLRVLQEGTFERLGAEKTIKVDVRIIAASSKNIAGQVQNGLFREDLYYRLNGFPIELPPLRERREDIPLLARHFLQKYGYEKMSFSERSMEMMRAYRWPGNVRELENTIRRAAILAQSEERRLIRQIDLPQSLRIPDDDSTLSYQPFDEQVLETLRALKFSHSCIIQTARALGNKDRGTITDYLRGLCFEHLVQADFDVYKAAAALADSQEDETIGRVKAKIEHYVDSAARTSKRQAAFKGLPKKYHYYLEQVFEFLDRKEQG